MPSSRTKTHEQDGNKNENSSARPKRRRDRPPVRVACAECRRLKLRCSEQFPCHNCVKKGCGTMTTGKGNRIVIANTETLHEKINQLAGRVRQLEDALAIAHSTNTREPHPLLREDLLFIKNPLELEKDTFAPKEDDKEDIDDTVDALGTLSISKRGRSAFFGHTANSWYVFQNEGSSDDSGEEESQPELPEMPSDIPWLSHSFLFSPPLGKTSEGILRSLRSCLPSPVIAREIVDVYYDEAGWMSTPVPRDEFYQTIYQRIYEPTTTSDADFIESHDLAVLYMLLAIGVQTDPRRPFNSPQAVQYFQLGRAALALKSPLEEHTMTALQALVLMSHYYFFADSEQPIWVLTGIVTRLCVSIGLHRDSGKFNLSPEETKRRRSVMWEVYTQDLWQSFLYGRPPAFSLPYIDTQMPHETTIGPGGEVEMNFHAWKHRFYGQLLSDIQQQTLSSRTPSYKAILVLDQRVREFYIPPSLLVPGVNGAPAANVGERPSTGLTAQRHMACFIKEMSIFYMHRGFFAKAVEERPDDPLAHKYSPSVLAVYNTACTFVGMMESLYALEPLLSERLWFLFGHVFSCALIFASIAEKRGVVLAASALANLDAAYHLFAQVSDNPRGAKVLSVLQKLKERAHNSVQPHTISEPHAPLAAIREPIPVPFPPFVAPGNLYPSSDLQLPPTSTQSSSASYSAPGFNPGPTMWLDYNSNNLEGFDDFWSPRSSAAQQEILAPNQDTYQSIPYYAGYPTGDYSVPDTDLDASWQNFMSGYYPQGT